jgi:hypothetical protein
MPDNTIEIESLYTGKAVVAHMDLLGFSKAVTETWPDTINTLNVLRKALINERTRCRAKIKNIDITFNPKIILISDSIFVIQKTEDIDYLTSIVSTYHLIENCYLIWRLCIENGFTVRGGITYGDIHWNEEYMQLQGPAIVSAINLEKQANYSRIICSEQFLKIYAELHKKDKIHSNRFIPLSNLLIDFDGKIVVNPLLLCQASKKNSHPIENKKLVLQELTELMKSCDKTIQSKYYPLIRHISMESDSYIPTINDLLVQSYCMYSHT